MSATAVIGMVEPCGSIKASYLHWDGYPSSTGVMLRRCYATPEAVAGLLAFGHISYLSETPEKCCFYHRDRKEYLRNARFSDTDSLLASNIGLYVYLWAGKEWLIFDQEGYPYEKTT